MGINPNDDWYGWCVCYIIAWRSVCPSEGHNRSFLLFLFDGLGLWPLVVKCHMFVHQPASCSTQPLSCNYSFTADGLLAVLVPFGLIVTGPGFREYNDE